MIIEVKDCTWEFKIQCPKNWYRMNKTDDPDVHFCGTCLKMFIVYRPRSKP